MAQIKINFTGVQTANAVLKKTLYSMKQLEQELLVLQRQIDPELQSRYGIAHQLRSCHNMAATLENRTRKLYHVVSDGTQKYQEAEAQLSRGTPNNWKGTHLREKGKP